MAKSRSTSKGSAVNLPRDLVIHIDDTLDSQTVSHVLKARLEGISWNQARGLSTANRVMINGNMNLDPARRLSSGEVLKVLMQPAGRAPTVADVHLYYVDHHIVVFEKPAGITSIRHAEEQKWSKRRRQLQATLDELLPAAIEKKQSAGRGKGKGNPPPIRMVHRLDRDTSGVMVAARTPAAELALVAQFKAHSAERAYLAVCQGKVESQTVRNHLVRDRGDGLRGSSLSGAEGKLAITHFHPLEHGKGYTLLQCRLETGRTHQIRIHLAELGNPVFGEKMYLKRLGQPALRDTSGTPRHALHAAELAIAHPAGGELMRFESPLPRDMQNLLGKLRRGK